MTNEIKLARAIRSFEYWTDWLFNDDNRSARSQHDARQYAADLTPGRRTGNEFEAYDDGVLDCYKAVEAALSKQQGQ